MQTILDSLRIVLSIRNTITVNAIINGIRHIPIIGKHIPETVYRVRVIKIISLIISIHIELFKAFFGKLGIFAGLLLFALPIGKIGEYSSSTIFLYGFTVFSLIFFFLTNVFDITAEAKYAVFYLGMDAKKYILSILFYRGFNTLAGYLLFGIPAALLAGVAWYFAILIPFAGVGLLVGKTGLMMYFYSLKISSGRNVNRKGVPSSIAGNTWFNILMFFILFFGGAIGALWVIDLNLYLIGEVFVALFALLLIPGFFLIRKAPYGLYRTALFAEDERRQVTQVKQKEEMAHTKELRLGNAEATSDKNGFEFLNDLFIKRHAKVLLGRLIGACIGTAASIALLSVYLHYELDRFEFPKQSTLRYVFTKHPGIFVHLLFILNSTESFARAMFANCDSALLNYGFYKTPKALLRMFTIRCKSAIKLNCIPAIMMTVFAMVTIILTGGEDFFLQCLFTALLIFIAVILFSVRYMTMYYLMQPYNGDFMVKNHVYTFFNLFSGFFTIVLIFIPVNAMILTAVLVVIAVPYVLVSGLLVRKFAPKTFRVK
ncbi:MAG: hypothetical protein IKI20_00585 [Lachnospiraceae bacterium]|nr:hypothetical protein [Lachnospiraceae bacterium]